MSDDQLLGVSQLCDLRGLACCRMIDAGTEFLFRIGKGGFVVEQGDAFDERGNVGLKHRVGAVCVGAWRFAFDNQFVVGDDVAFCRNEVGTRFDVVDLADGNLVAFDGFTPYVWQERFFFEKVTTAADAVFEGDAIDRYAAVFVNGLKLMGVDGVEDDLIFHTIAKVVEHGTEHVFDVFRPVDMERSGAAE